MVDNDGHRKIKVGIIYVHKTLMDTKTPRIKIVSYWVNFNLK